MSISSEEIVDRGKRGISRVIFGRSLVFTALVLLQIFVMLIMFTWVARYINIRYIYVAYQLFMAFLVLYIINLEEDPSFKLAWIVPILILPVSGPLFYVFIKVQSGNKKLNRKIMKVEEETKQYAIPTSASLAYINTAYPDNCHIAGYLDEKAGFPSYENTSVNYYALGELQFEEIKVQLRKAKHFIFLEYFIVQEGKMWDSILEILKEKAKEGVEVRLMYDGTCMFSLLPPNYPRKLEAMGIHCKIFAPVKPLLSTVQNNRDHRKILIVDGKTAFTGGINLADEYINERDRFGHWKDTGIMLQGDAVRSFTLMFLRLWNLDYNSDDYKRFLNSSEPKPDKSTPGFVIPYADSPLDTEQVGEQVYLQLLYHAKHYVHIMTPYLILDQNMITALTFAAKRGVDVKIVMPHKPDKWYALALAITYYHELIEAGVKIYEYMPGFVHAKSFVVDDRQAVVGSINLDFRSLYLHFECAAYFCDVPCIHDMEDDYQDTLTKCRLVTKETIRERGIFQLLMGKILRLIAPLM